MTVLDELQERLDGVTVYSNYLSSICPFHVDSRPSLLVYSDWYECKACGARGKPEKLLAKVSTGSYIPRQQYQGRRNPFTQWMKQQSLSEVLKAAHQNLKQNSWYGKYLENRGITYQSQLKSGLGIRDGYVTFPVVSQNRKIIGAVCRSIEGKNFFVPNGQDPNLLLVPSWKRIEQSREVYLVFGVVDAYSLYELGLPSMSTLSGKKLDPSALDWCQKRINIVPDWQEREEAERLASCLGWRGKVKNLDYDVGQKDVNDALLQWNKSSLVSALA